MITVDLVKELRERTGAGMMECKKALVEVEGDIEKAIDLMRKSGQAKAAKKAGRVAAEGVVVVCLDTAGKNAALLEVNSETDFVARGDELNNFAKQVAERALEIKATDIDSLLAAQFVQGNSQSIEQARQELIIKVGENINVRRVFVLSSPNQLGTYIHGGRIGVLVELQGGDVQLAKDIAMHIAAVNPVAVSPSDVSPELVNKEKEIALAQAETSGKPAAIIEKMVQGRVTKFLNEVSLMGQAFVKNPEITIEKLVGDAKAKVISFKRFEVGEGIEKQTTDFVAEVMAQARGG